MIEFKCDNCHNIFPKEKTRTVVIHPRDRKIWTKFPIKNPNRKKFGSRLLCLKCLHSLLNYNEDTND